MNDLRLFIKRLDRPFILPLILAVMALAGGLIIWFNSPWGVEAGYDSFFYITAAKNLLGGAGLGRLQPDGLLIPLTHYPPLYSWLLAGLGLLFGGDILLSARLFSALMFAFNVFLFGWVIFFFTRSRWFAVAAALLALVSPIFYFLNLSAMTEGLYLNLLLLTLLILTLTLDHLNWRGILLAGVLTALACLTRYVGSTVIALGLLAILLLNHNPWRKKLGMGVIYGLVSGLPLALWYLRNWLLTGSATNRVFSMHWPARQDYVQAVESVASWLLPDTNHLKLIILVLVLLIVFTAAAVILWCRRIELKKILLSPDLSIRFILLLGAHILVYYASLWVSRAFFDASTKWDVRILSPLYLSATLIAFLLAWFGFQLDKFLLRRTLLTIALLALCSSYILRSNTLVDQSRGPNSNGFTSQAWRSSQTIKALEALPSDWIFYTNNTTAIYFNIWRPEYGIPEVFDSVKNQPRAAYAQDLARMRQFLQQPHTALVIFDPYGDHPEYPPLAELTQGLQVVKKTQDGTIYALNHP